MSFQLQGGNASSNDYDYQSGAGIDNFMSRSIDEVSWQSSLGSSYSSLSELPIGLSPTTATPTNFDATQVSGSLGGGVSMGGNSSSAGGSGNVVIDGSNGRISVFDKSGNEVIRMGDLGD